MNASRCVSVALIQMSCSTSKQANVDKALTRIAEVARRGAQVICLPELFHDRYPCQTEDHARFGLAETIPGPTTGRLQEVARRHQVAIVGSLFERRAAGLYHNTAIVLDSDGSQSGTYRKMHIPDDPYYYEKFYFAPGDQGFLSFATRFGRLGVGICWDQWFPESARLTALSGAELLFYPTAIGWLPDEEQPIRASQQAAWETMIRSHAIANGVFVAAPNRVGQEDQLDFWGDSLVVDPYGNVLARASRDSEETLIVECDLNLVDTARTHWPFLRDRRVDAYAGLTQRYLDPST